MDKIIPTARFILENPQHEYKCWILEASLPDGSKVVEKIVATPELTADDIVELYTEKFNQTIEELLAEEHTGTGKYQCRTIYTDNGIQYQRVNYCNIVNFEKTTERFIATLQNVGRSFSGSLDQKGLKKITRRIKKGL